MLRWLHRVAQVANVAALPRRGQSTGPASRTGRRSPPNPRNTTVRSRAGTAASRRSPASPLSSGLGPLPRCTAPTTATAVLPPPPPRGGGGGGGRPPPPPPPPRAPADP